MICLRKIANLVKRDKRWPDLDDIIQECALAMMCPPGSALSPGYATAIIHDVKDVFLSRKWRDTIPKGTRHIRLLTIEPPHSPEDEYIDNIIASQFLESLPTFGREIVEFYYMQGLTQAEIADRLDIGRSMVSKHLRTMLAGAA